jgi:hypothetical protein
MWMNAIHVYVCGSARVRVKKVGGGKKEEINYYRIVRKRGM